MPISEQTKCRSTSKPNADQRLTKRRSKRRFRHDPNADPATNQTPIHHCEPNADFVHSDHAELTSPPILHGSPITADALSPNPTSVKHTSRIRCAFYIYIYIYLYNYLLFYLIFLIIHFLFKLCSWMFKGINV